MKILFILNPCAGKLRGKQNIDTILGVYKKYPDISVELFETTARGDATRIAAERGNEFDRIVCCGGDGTLNETVAGLMSLENIPPVGYIPAGSTNDFAATLGITGSFEQNTERTITGKPSVIDIGRFNDRYFSYTASFGAFTQTSYAAPQKIKNSLGHFAYFLQAAKDLNTIRPYHATVIADEKVYDEDFVFGAVCNSTSIGGFMKLKPELVDLKDGLFEAVLIKNPKNPAELASIASAILSHNFESNKHIILFHASSLTVKTDGNIPWSLDGEYDAGLAENTIENRHHAISIIV